MKNINLVLLLISSPLKNFTFAKEHALKSCFNHRIVRDEHILQYTYVKNILDKSEKKRSRKNRTEQNVIANIITTRFDIARYTRFRGTAELFAIGAIRNVRVELPAKFQIAFKGTRSRLTFPIKDT